MEPLTSFDPQRIGQFEILGRLGRGGMGQVYLGQTKGDDRAAIKVMLEHHATEPTTRARFGREIEIARRVNSPFVARVIDADADADRPWLATEYIVGPTVAQAVANDGPLPEAALKTFMVAMCEALSVIHDANLVHRDLKPSNVILSPTGPKIIDFGIAYAPDMTALTRSNNYFVSVAYASPEQLRGQRVGPPADIFALGGLMIFAATGRPPFNGGNIAIVAIAIGEKSPDLSGVPTSLQPLLRGCLAKDSASRPTTQDIISLLGGTASARGTDWLPDPHRHTVHTQELPRIKAPDSTTARGRAKVPQTLPYPGPPQ